MQTPQLVTTYDKMINGKLMHIRVVHPNINITHISEAQYDKAQKIAQFVKMFGFNPLSVEKPKEMKELDHN